jgi:hypothetical protein
MKMKVIAFVLLSSVIVTVGAVLSVMGQFSMVNSSTTIPKQLTNSAVVATAVTLIGNSAPQTANAGTVYVGYGISTDALQPIAVASGAIVNLRLDEGRANFVLSNIWFDVSVANDGLTILYDQVK